MPRLLPCPACERHVLASERACPFCGVRLAIEPAASLLSIALLGLTLVVGTTACDSPKKEPDGTKATPKPTEPADQILVPAPEPAPKPDPMPEEPTTAIAIEPTIEPPIEEPPTPTTDGSTVEDDRPATKPKPKPDPDEDPRPAKTYGGPPNPKDPFDPGL